MNKSKFIILGLCAAIATGAGLKAISETAPISIYTQRPLVTASAQVLYTPANALDVVANPTKFLKKNIKISGKFDKYSTLGLDYAPALRSSEEYITFLIQRPDVKTHNIPLSELKIFLKKDIAEKNIDLDAGDEVEFTGRVFSTALGDAWMDVDDFKVLTSKKDTKKSETTK